MSLGRAPDNKVVLHAKEGLPDSAKTSISRYHAQIDVDDRGTVWLTDTKSVNGTFVAGWRLAPSVRHVLCHNDEIVFGGSSAIPVGCAPHTWAAAGKELQRVFAFRVSLPGRGGGAAGDGRVALATPGAAPARDVAAGAAAPHTATAAAPRAAGASAAAAAAPREVTRDDGADDAGSGGASVSRAVGAALAAAAAPGRSSDGRRGVVSPPTVPTAAAAAEDDPRFAPPRPKRARVAGISYAVPGAAFEGDAEGAAAAAPVAASAAAFVAASAAAPVAALAAAPFLASALLPLGGVSESCTGVMAPPTSTAPPAPVAEPAPGGAAAALLTGSSGAPMGSGAVLARAVGVPAGSGSAAPPPFSACVPSCARPPAAAALPCPRQPSCKRARCPDVSCVRPAPQ